MQFLNYISKYKKTLFSFEILPTLLGEKSIFNLIQFKPVFITITCHLDTYLYYIPNTIYNYLFYKRPGNLDICATIINKMNLVIIPHYITTAYNNHILENNLIDLNNLGINNLLIIRGDRIATNISPLDIIKKITILNKGIYLHNNICIGVAGYSEKHFEYPIVDEEILYLKKKILSGAKYIITQMFFDNSFLFDFVSLCRCVGIEVPIIPSIKIITAKYQINTILYTYKVNIPNVLLQEIHNTQNNNIVKEIGIEWAINQSLELIKYGVPVIHYYTMNRSVNITKILKDIF